MPPREQHMPHAIGQCIILVSPCYLPGTVSAGLRAAAGTGLLLLAGALVLDHADVAAAAFAPILPPATRQYVMLLSRKR